MQGIFSQYDSQDLNRLAAKGILEKLRTIRQRINVDFTSRRLIWELIQNAKDNAASCNINGDSNVKIEIDLNPKQLRFSHDNGYFTNENVRGLIRRYSSSEKDRDIDVTAPPSATTGRFGTGFMTTHLLSEKVTVKGAFQQLNNSLCIFELPLDRTGQSEKEIIQSIEKSFNTIEESMNTSECFDISSQRKLTSEFLYDLNDEGFELAKISIDELDDSIAYSLISIPNIEKVTINQNSNSFFYKTKEIKEFQAKNHVITIIEITSNNHETVQSHYATIIDNDTRIIIPINYSDNKIEIKNPSTNVPRLFLDFPLIGTEELNIPFVINSPLFEPTEPRDGVSLTGGDDKDTLINSGILKSAFKLYNELINYASNQKDWSKLYNLARIKKPKDKVWIDQVWYSDNILNPIRKILLTTTLVDANSGKRISIQDSEGKNQVYFPSSNKAEVREIIWELSNSFFPESLPTKKQIHEWHSVIWKDCYDQTLNELSEDIQKEKDLKTLSETIKKQESETIEWLNQFYDLLNLEENTIDEVLKDKLLVIPNQNGVFKKKSELFWDRKIENELKNVLELLGIDIREKLRDRRIVTVSKYTDTSDGQVTHYVKEQKDIINQINERLKVSQNSSKAISYLISLFSFSDDFPKKRKNIYEFSKKLIGDSIPEIKEINSWDDSIWEYADKARINRLIKIVSNSKSIEELVSLISADSIQSANKWLQSFIDFLNKNNLSGKLNLKENPILPNQNGFFRVKDDLFLDSGEIDEDLKDIAKELSYDIRGELLDKEIFLELPENRVRTQEQVAEEISKLIKPILRDVNAREDNKDVVRKLYLWMNKNRLVAEQIFGDVYEKRFLLVSDDEIAANMEKAEIFDEIIKTTGLSASEIKNKLIALLSNSETNISGLEGLKTNGNLYPIGSEDDIMISPDLIDGSSEKSRISTSEDAKEKIFETLRSNGFTVPAELDINYTIVSGISKPDGTPIKIVVKSGKAGKIYFNPNEWLALTESDTQLFVVSRGNVVRNITLKDLSDVNDIFHMRFNTEAFAVNTNLKAFANFFRYLRYTHFIFDTPESTTDYLQEFGLNQRNPSADTLTSDDKNLLH
jgi:hypothetical protein